MKVDPAELSGYLDGELTGERAREVESALDADPALRVEFDALRKADEKWRAAARSAMFSPVDWGLNSKSSMHRWLRVAGALTALVLARVTCKAVGEFETELLLQSAMLAPVLLWIVRMIRAPSAAAGGH